MNARISEARARNSRMIDTQIQLVLNEAKVAAEQSKFAAMIAECMILTEGLDRILLDTPEFSFSKCYVYGKRVLIVRFGGMNYRIFAGGIEFCGITELANEAAEWAVETGLVALVS